MSPATVPRAAANANSEPASFRLGFVIPVGPGGDPRDTVESILQFSPSDSVIVMVDDSGGGLDAAGLPTSDQVLVVSAGHRGGPNGTAGVLYLKILDGIRALLGTADVDAIVKMDDDAVMLGPGLHRLIQATFATHPRHGILGAYTTGPNGGVRDYTDAARILRCDRGVTGLARPRLRALLRQVTRSAERHGYVGGEHVLGGAYILQRELAHWLCRSGIGSNRIWSQSRLGEDHLISLLARSAGYTLGDLSGPDDPLAVQWRGLSAPPEELVAAGKILAHSVDF